MRFYIPLLLCVACLIGIFPALMYGFEFGMAHNIDWFIPIPSMLCCIGVGIFGCLVERHADE